MSVRMRRRVIILLGTLSGLCTWPAVEIVLSRQARFASYLLFYAVTGAIAGALMGCYLGVAEGITSRVRVRTVPGMLVGGLVGGIGGASGMLLGQAADWLVSGLSVGSSPVRSFLYPACRSLGWALLGLFVGAGEGVRARSPRKMLVGLLGGFTGGLAGGLALEYARLLLPGTSGVRLVGFLVLGISIASCHALIEARMSAGVLHVLTGPMKGREFLLIPRMLRLGSAPRNEIALPGYGDLADVQARVRVFDGQAVLSNAEPRLPLLLNDRTILESGLRPGDVIHVGSARLLYLRE